MKILPGILFLSLLFYAGCKKKGSSEEPQPQQPVPVAPQDTIQFKCQDLPPDPVPFGWTDSTADPNKNVKCFFYNPLDADEVIAVVEGDMSGYNQMVNVNLRTKVRKNLAPIDDFLPSINSKGWIVYSTLDNNIYMIKANGDSLRQLTAQNVAHDPKWDNTGTYFYFFQDPYFNVPAKLIRADKNGGEVFSLPQGTPLYAVLRSNEKVVYQKKGASDVTLVLRDFTTQEESELIKGNLLPGGAPFFNYLTVDQIDENLYWSNKYGIFKWNFSTRKTDTVFKNCENMIYDFPMMSRSNEMTYSLHTIKPVLHYFLLHEFAAMELNNLSREKREIRIFK